MSLDDISFLNDSPKSGQNLLIMRIRQLEKDNKALIEINEGYKNELQQKSIALQKSTSEYASLKRQYEELLQRVSQLRLENRIIQSANSSPNNSNSSDSSDLIASLRRQAHQISQRKEFYKSELSKCEATISNL